MNNILLDLPVPFRNSGGEIHAESQALNGIRNWLNNFDAVTVCAPLIPESMVNNSVVWDKIDFRENAGRLRLVQLPWGYHPVDHFRYVGRVRDIYTDLVDSHRYLCFSNLGYFGAWGSLAADIAFKRGRKYSVWLDWVLHEMPRRTSFSRIRKILNDYAWRKMRDSSIKSIKNCSLGLFHGRSVYEGYYGFCSNSHLVHDIHLGVEDIIKSVELTERFDKPKNSPFSIVYVGRVHPMKGPLDWLDIVHSFIEGSSRERIINATWFGDGPLLEQCRKEVVNRKLEDKVFFPGQINDRDQLLSLMRCADVFLQCHLTPESPRCLIEALMSGLPIVGYDSPYVRDLVSADARAGLFSDAGDINGGVENLRQVISKSSFLEEMALAAFQCGSGFSDTAVFKHRSDLIKRYL